MENMDKGLTLTKWVMIVPPKIPKIPKMPKNLLAQFVCPISKFGISMKKGFIERPWSVLRWLLLPLSFAPNSPRALLAFHVMEDDSFSHESFDHFSIGATLQGRLLLVFGLHVTNIGGVSTLLLGRPKILTNKVDKTLKSSLDSVPSPSPSVKIQIMGGKV